jgi:adenosylhomocysteine nucleosidase
MTTDTIIITALASELDASLLPNGVQIYYSGIGKLNAAIATFKAIGQTRPKRIFNFGTVGAVASHASGLIEIHRVVQRDMIAEPLAPRGQVPFCTRPYEYLSGSGRYTCGTGDSFVMAKDPWFEANNVDVVDMELFAIAAIAHLLCIDKRIGDTDGARVMVVTPFRDLTNLLQRYFPRLAGERTASTWRDMVAPHVPGHLDHFGRS